MSDPFEVRERSFYVTGEMTDFDMAAVQDYLGQQGLRVMEKPIPIKVYPVPEWASELEIAEPEDVITQEDFIKAVDQIPNLSGIVKGASWKRLLETTRDKKLALELRQTESYGLGFTYESADIMLAVTADKSYRGYRPTSHARKVLELILSERKQAQTNSDS